MAPNPLNSTIMKNILLLLSLIVTLLFLKPGICMAQKADDGYAAVRDSLNEVLNKSNDWSKRKSAYLNQFDLYFGENSKAKLCLSMLYSEGPMGLLMKLILCPGL